MIDVYITGVHRHCFRDGEPARIIGVVGWNDVNYGWRPCYHVEYGDGFRYLIPISDYCNYKLTPKPEKCEVTE